MMEIKTGQMNLISRKPDKWLLVSSKLQKEVAKVFRNKDPKLTKDESILLAYCFLEDEICYDHFYDIASIVNIPLDDPFIYDNKCPIGINEPYFSDWIDYLLSIDCPILCIPGDFDGELNTSIFVI